MSATAAEQRLSRRDACRKIDIFFTLFPDHASPVAVRWDVAGSYRRECESIGDIEHVVIPRYREQPAKRDGLFGTDSKPPPINLLWEHIDQLVAEGRLAYGRAAAGDRFRQVICADVQHDIFIASPQTWGYILAIRTGPKEFSQRIVSALRKNGYIGFEGTVYRLSNAPNDPQIPGMSVAEAEKRRCLTADGEVPRGTPMSTPREETVFQLAGWRSDIPPTKRGAPPR